MQTNTNERFITQMKLRELRRQREKLLAAYADIEQHLSATPERPQAVRVLYDGLRDLTFAEQHLHPSVRQLDVVIHKLTASQSSGALVAFWLERLRQELAMGQRRTNIMYLFGALLEEWFATAKDESPASPEETTRYQAELAYAQQPAPVGDYHALLDIFAGDQPLLPAQTPLSYAERTHEPYEMSYSPDGDEIISFDYGQTTMPREQILLPAFRDLDRRIEERELQEALEAVRVDWYRASELRAQATRILADPVLLRELADALSIQVQQLADWAWPADGVATTLRWQRSRYRLYLDEDLPTTCLLDVLGARWQSILHEHLNVSINQQIGELEQLSRTGASAATIEATLARIARSPSPFLRYHRDIWAEARPTPPAEEPQARLSALLASYGMQPSVTRHRAQAIENLHAFAHFNDYHDIHGAAGVAPTLTLTEAELALARARFPGRPLYVAKADIRQFYASLSHEVILTLLHRLGVPERECAFFARFLAIPLRVGNDVVMSQRGIPINRKLADALGEIVLRTLDMHVQAQANVQMIRIVDDITLIASSPEDLTRGWQTLVAGITALGLALNEEKCGAVAINGTLPPGLPTTLPRWMMVTLDGHGSWHHDTTQVAAFRAATLRQVVAAPTVMAAVSVYNQQITYLEQALMAHIWLGETYQAEVFATLLRFHEELLAEGRGIIFLLSERLSQRAESATLDLPDAWYHWPITAGGLALHDPAILTGSYRLGHRTPQMPTAMTADWHTQPNQWSLYYQQLLNTAHQAAPQSDPLLETLVNDFIERGKALSKGKQKGLSEYWRWVLASYGPQLLAAFGSFRFLFSELVPLHLITNRSELLNNDPDML